MRLLLNLLQGRGTQVVVLLDPLGLPLPPRLCTRPSDLVQELLFRRQHPTLLLGAPVVVAGPPVASDRIELLARHTILCADPASQPPLGGQAFLEVWRATDLLIEISSPTTAKILRDRQGRCGVFVTFDFPEPSCWTEHFQ